MYQARPLSTSRDQPGRALSVDFKSKSYRPSVVPLQAELFHTQILDGHTRKHRPEYTIINYF